MRQFIFLYPIDEIFDHEIENGAYPDDVDEYRSRYAATLNACIDMRYRRKGFGINLAVFDGAPVSDVIDISSGDRIIEVGVDLTTHKGFVYPDLDYILDLAEGQIIRIAGFHMWDCVDKLAKRSYERGLDTLVDEDLTEFLPGRLMDADFMIDAYPTYDPIKHRQYERFYEARQDRPWLWDHTK